MKINKYKIIFLLLFIFVIVAGAYYLRVVWVKSLAEKSAQIMLIAKTSEISLNGEMLKQLHGVPEDIGTVAYESIKNRLIKLKEVDSNIRFAYIYKEKDGEIYFMADSELVDSDGYSPPGQEYSEAAKEYFQPFIDKKSFITEPVVDRWGEWISVLVPMVDSSNEGKVSAVFGIDYPAKDWNHIAWRQTLQAGVLVSFALLLLISFYLVISSLFKARISAIKVAKIKQEQEKILDSIPAWVFYKDDKNNFIRVNKAFADVMKLSKEQLEGKSVFDIFPKEQAENFWRDDKEVIASGKSKNNIIEKMSSPDGDRWVETDKIIFRDDNNVIIGIIGFSIDITSKKKSEDEINIRNEQLERINRLMVGRELEMINLKKELAELKNPKTNENSK